VLSGTRAELAFLAGSSAIAGLSAAPRPRKQQQPGWEHLAAEAALYGGTLGPLARPIRPGESYAVPVVFDLPRGADQQAAHAAALADERIRRYVNGAQVRKVIYVPDKLLNLVVGG